MKLKILLRDRIDAIPDIVRLDWQRAPTNAGAGVEIYAYDHLDKKHTLYESNGTETSATVENVSRFIVQDAGPAVARPYRFAIASTNRSGPSEEVFAAAPLSITSKVKPVEPPTPDEIAGTTREVTYATLKAEVFSDVMTALGTLPTEGQAIVNSTLDHIVLKIKDVVRKGGGYGRVRNGPADANWSAPGGGDGQVHNLVTVAFNLTTTDWSTVVGFGLYDALTGGNAWILAPLETSLTVRVGDPPPIFAPGDLVVTLA